MDEKEPIDVEFEDVPTGGEKGPEGEARQEEPAMQELEEEQQEERDYFAKQEEKINGTKEKLQALLAKMQEQPEKDTIRKKLLRARIDRLRSKLNRRMTKFDIEYLADLEENADYDNFRDECDEIRDRIEALEDLEEKLEIRLETYIRIESYRSTNNSKLDSKIQKMAPKSQRTGQTAQRTVRNAARKSKAAQVREQLEDVRAEIEGLEAELKEKIVDYQEYKKDMKTQTKADVRKAMENIKATEAEMKRQRKEELAVTKPSLWAKIRGGIKSRIEKISAWNERRKSEKAQRADQKDRMVSDEANEVLSQKTARQRFLEDNEIDHVTRENIAKTVIKVQEEQRKAAERQANPILQEYISRSSQGQVDEMQFIEEMKAKSYTVEQLREGMKLIDQYRSEQKKTKEEQEQK